LSPKPRYLVFILVGIFIVWAMSGLFIYRLGVAERGVFGDMFGAVNALFSGMAFGTLIYTAWLQKEELALQRRELTLTREELKGQKKAIELQTETFELQRFESTFFSLMAAQRSIVEAMEIRDHTGVWSSVDCFKDLYIRLQEVHSRDGIHAQGQGNVLVGVRGVYESVYNQFEFSLGHYFRHLYHIIKFINESNVQNKKRYASLVRAQLSSYEHVLLFYNGLGIRGSDKFKPLVEKFSLLENMPLNLLLEPKLHASLYDVWAFGDDKVAVSNLVRN
jgi:hypothetical protein